MRKKERERERERERGGGGGLRTPKTRDGSAVLNLDLLSSATKKKTKKTKLTPGERLIKPFSMIPLTLFWLVKTAQNRGTIFSRECESLSFASLVLAQLLRQSQNISVQVFMLLVFFFWSAGTIRLVGLVVRCPLRERQAWVRFPLLPWIFFQVESYH